MFIILLIMPTKAQLTQKVKKWEELVISSAENQLYMKARIKELKAQKNDLQKSLNSWKEQADTLYDELQHYRSAFEEMDNYHKKDLKKIKELREENKKLVINLKQVDDCILLAHRGKVKQRYEEMEKPWTKLFGDLD